MKGKNLLYSKKLIVFFMVIVISFGCLVQPVHALEPGQIEYKEEDCSWYEAMCKMQNWLTKIAVECWNATISWFVNFMKISPGEVLGKRGLDRHGNVAPQPKDGSTTQHISAIVAEYYGYFETAAWVFLELFFVYQMIQILARYVLEADASELKDLLYRLVVSAILLGALPYIISMLLTCNEWFIEDLLRTQVKFSDKSGLNKVLSEGAAIIIIFVALVFMMIFVILQQMVRYAEICFMTIISPLVVATYLNKNSSLLGQWWKTLLSTIFTQAVQLLLFVLFLKTMAGAKISNIVDFFLPLGFIMLVVKSPAALQDLIYNSGSEKMAGKGTVAAFKGAKAAGTKAAKVAIWAKSKLSRG